MVRAFDGDPGHPCTGRSAPARLRRALEHADRLEIKVPTLRQIADEQQRPRLMSTAQILPGSAVVLHLSIALEDGTEAISHLRRRTRQRDHRGRHPATRTGTALYGLRAGDTQTINLFAEQAFGLRDTNLIQYMPMTEFEAAFTPEVGQIVAFSLPNGDEARA